MGAGRDRGRWEFALEAQLTRAHPEIRANAGKVAIERGPLVYCLEEVDNGTPLASVSITAAQKLEANYEAGLLGGAITVS